MRATEALREILSLLPKRFEEEISALGAENIEEIRLRKGVSSLTCGGGNVILGSRIEGRELENLLAAFTGGSVYSKEDSIKEGYVTLNCGARVGIAGKAVYRDGKISGITDISSLSVRIPRSVIGCGEYPARLIRRSENLRGILLYSPPGVGKTTVLRDVCRILSTGENPMRLAVVDTREEICPTECGTLDLLSGFGRAEGIETAVRALNPELIVCDEIGTDADCAAVATSARAGIPLLATAHGSSPSDIYARKNLRSLAEGGFFSCLLGLSRHGERIAFRRDEAEP